MKNPSFHSKCCKCKQINRFLKSQIKKHFKLRILNFPPQAQIFLITLVWTNHKDFLKNFIKLMVKAKWLIFINPDQVQSLDLVWIDLIWFMRLRNV